MNPFAVIGLVVDLIGMAPVVAGVVVGGGARWPVIIAGVTLSFVGMAMFVIGRKAGRFFGLSPRLPSRGAAPRPSPPATTKAIPTRSTTRPMTANGFMPRRYRPVRSTAAPDTRPSFSRCRAVLASARG